MKVAITGGTGYLGPAVVEEMLRAGHEVVALEHRTPIDLVHTRLRHVSGDLKDPRALAESFAGCEALVHLVAIIREDEAKGITFEKVHVDGTRRVLEAAALAGIPRFLLMSANGVDSGLETPYFRTKLEMERLVKASGLAWTIFRPSYIAGSEPGGFDSQFVDIVDMAPVLPSFAGGKFKIQPISRKNVAEAFTRALSTPASVGKTYVLVGPERMSWNSYLRRLAKLRGRKRILAYAPGWAAIGAARVLGPLMPADADSLRMLMQGNTGDASEAVKEFALDLEPWESAVAGLRR